MPPGALARQILQMADEAVEAGGSLDRFLANRAQRRAAEEASESLGEAAGPSLRAFGQDVPVEIIPMNPAVEANLSQLAYGDPQTAAGIVGSMLRTAETPQEFYEAFRATRILRGDTRGAANMPSAGSALENFRLNQLRRDFPRASDAELLEMQRSVVREPFPREVQDAIDQLVIEAAQRMNLSDDLLDALKRQGLDVEEFSAATGIPEDVVEEAARAIDEEALRTMELGEDVATFGTQAMPPQSLSAAERLGIVTESGDITSGARELRTQTTDVPDARDFRTVEVETADGPGTVQIPVGRRYTPVEDDPRLAERLLGTSTSEEMFASAESFVNRMRDTGSESSLRAVAGEIQRAVQAGELNPDTVNVLRREYMRELRRVNPPAPPRGAEQSARSTGTARRETPPTAFTPWAESTFGGPGGAQFRRRVNPLDAQQSIVEQWVAPPTAPSQGRWVPVPGTADYAGSSAFTTALPRQLALPGTTVPAPRPPLWTDFLPQGLVD